LENPLAALQHRPPEFGELGAAVIDHGHVHGAENPVRDRARPWNLQKMPSLPHDNLPKSALRAILHSFFVLST
jgi:hypothetical protein